MNDINSITHTTWNCKYHIIFAPKYKRKVFYGEKRLEIGKILRTLCEWKKVKIVEAEAGGEDLQGRIMVANVIFNRMKSPEFPDTVYDIVWEKTAGTPQFSPTADGRIHTVTVSEETREAVNRAIDGEDYSEGALFFMQEEYSDSANVSWFKKNLKYLFSHGVHDFYTYPE